MKIIESLATWLVQTCCLGPFFMIGVFSKWSPAVGAEFWLPLVGAFMVSTGISLVVGKCERQKKVIAEQNSILDELCKIIIADHPGTEFGSVSWRLHRS